MTLSKTLLSGLQFLVVDDEPDNVAVMVTLLKRMGAVALSAENGQKGLEIAKSNKPDLILCDLSMPIMSGWEMLYEIRQHHDMRDIPVIALTAHAMAGDRERVLQAGFSNYIPKPIDIPKFIPMFLGMMKDIPQFTELIQQQDGNTR